MSYNNYQIVTDRNGWIMNEQGEVQLRDKENQQDIWIENNQIYFDEYQRPCVKIFDGIDSQPEEIRLSFCHLDRDTENSQQTELDDTLTNDSRLENESTWSENETKRLIALYAEHQDDLKNAKKKKFVWDIISERMVERNFQKSAAKCQRKWINLCRVYRSMKDQKKSNQSGRARKTPFTFYNLLDDILGELPSNNKTYSVDVTPSSETDSIEQATENDFPTDNIPGNSVLEESQNVLNNNAATSAATINKRKNYTQEYYKSKINYHKMKVLEGEQKNNRHKEKMDLERQKVKIEQKKVDVLQELLLYTKRNHEQ